jgi:hypothetical protein
MLLSQLTLTQIQALLLTNPNASVFSFSTNDSGGPVTRAQLVTAYQALIGPTNSGNFDPTTGFFNSQTYSPATIVNAGIQLKGGLQCGGSPLVGPTPAPAFAGSDEIVVAPAQVL